MPAEKLDAAGQAAQAARLREEAKWCWRRLTTARSCVAILRAQRAPRQPPDASLGGASPW